MFKPQYDLNTNIINNLLAIERVKGFLDALRLKDVVIQRMQREARARDVYHSTHIEGTEVTLEETRRILEGQDVPEVQHDHRKEVENYDRALDFVSGFFLRDEAVTEELIQDIHSRLVKDVREDEAKPGKYRKKQNYIVNSTTREVVYTPPPHYEVPALMKDLVGWFGRPKSISHIIEAGIAQFQLVHIHPFLDGNGRTARILSTLVLYRSGYDFKRLFSLSQYYDRDRKAYYRALQDVRRRDMNMTPWLEYFTSGLKSQLIEIEAEGNELLRRDALEERIAGIRLNDRQKRALEHMLQNGHITRGEYVDQYECSLRTANYDLVELERLKLLVREGASRATRYRLAPPLG